MKQTCFSRTRGTILGGCSCHAVYKLREYIGEWRLNHIHSIDDAEVIIVSFSDFSAETDYSPM